MNTIYRRQHSSLYNMLGDVNAIFCRQHTKSYVICADNFNLCRQHNTDGCQQYFQKIAHYVASCVQSLLSTEDSALHPIFICSHCYLLQIDITSHVCMQSLLSTVDSLLYVVITICCRQYITSSVYVLSLLSTIDSTLLPSFLYYRCYLLQIAHYFHIQSLLSTVDSTLHPIFKCSHFLSTADSTLCSYLQQIAINLLLFYQKITFDKFR